MWPLFRITSLAHFYATKGSDFYLLNYFVCWLDEGSNEFLGRKTTQLVSRRQNTIGYLVLAAMWPWHQSQRFRFNTASSQWVGKSHTQDKQPEEACHHGADQSAMQQQPRKYHKMKDRNLELVCFRESKGISNWNLPCIPTGILGTIQGRISDLALHVDLGLNLFSVHCILKQNKKIWN